MEKLNIAIADDNALMVQLLDQIVSSDEELRVVGKAGNGEELIDIIKEKKPDVVLMDIIMPKLAGRYCDFSSGSGKNDRRCV